MRRKSFSLVLLILIIVLVVFLVILLVSLINKPHKKSDDKNQTSQTVENKLDASFIESLNDIASSDEESPQSNDQTTQEEDATKQDQNVPKTNSEETVLFNLNGYDYRITKNAKTLLVDSVSGNQEMMYELNDKPFTINYGSNSEKTFQELKASEDLTSYIESKYGITLTSKLKTGNINNLDLIICSASEGEKQIYLLFTPLTDSEIAYAKIYNKTNINELLSDISEPLSEISSIISSKE